MKPIRTVIMGAAGRDFHNFNVVYRDNPQLRRRRLHRHADPEHRRPQVPGVARRARCTRRASRSSPRATCRSSSAGTRSRRWSSPTATCPTTTCMDRAVDRQRRRRRLQAARAERRRCSTSTKPVIAVCAVRTGSGKSQTTRRIAADPARGGPEGGRRAPPDAVRQPREAARPALRAIADLKKHQCTIEEIEEYEPHIVSGTIIYAGVDYGDILAQAAGRGGRHPVGRRQQRHAVLQARPAHRRRRPAARRERADVLPRRDQPAPGRRRHHQQGRHRRHRTPSTRCAPTSAA